MTGERQDATGGGREATGLTGSPQAVWDLREATGDPETDVAARTHCACNLSLSYLSGYPNKLDLTQDVQPNTLLTMKL